MTEQKKTTKKKAPAAKSATLTIRAKHQTGFYRCGRFWPHDGREIALSELSEKEVAALKAENNLIVE